MPPRLNPPVNHYRLRPPLKAKGETNFALIRCWCDLHSYIHAYTFTCFSYLLSVDKRFFSCRHTFACYYWLGGCQSMHTVQISLVFLSRLCRAFCRRFLVSSLPSLLSPRRVFPSTALVCLRLYTLCCWTQFKDDCVKTVWHHSLVYNKVL